MTFDVEQAKPDLSVGGLDNSELLLVHGELHAYWREFEEYGRTVEDWSRDSLIRVHDEIRSELRSRDLPHQGLNGLDDEAVAQTMEVQFEPVEQRSFEQVGGSFVDAEEWR